MGPTMKTERLPNPIQLTRMIFDYWLNWVTVPHKTTLWSLSGDAEGLFWYDGHNATFWYMLNVSWYAMNDKLYARTDCKELFDETLRDFDPEYLAEYYS